MNIIFGKEDIIILRNSLLYLLFKEEDNLSFKFDLEKENSVLDTLTKM